MKRLIAILLTMFMLSTLTAQTNQYPYVVVTDDSNMSISEDDFYARARSVEFAVSKWIVPENERFAQELINDILPQMDKRGYQLKKIMMRGAASPEGAHDWNVKLGQNRLNAIFNIIKQHAKIPVCDDCIYKSELAEDYPYLLRMMKEANDPDYETVNNVVKKWGIDDVWHIKSELKKINYMKLWKRLLAEYFPQLRAARVVLFFAPYDKYNPLDNLDTFAPDADLVKATPLDTGAIRAMLNKGLPDELLAKLPKYGNGKQQEAEPAEKPELENLIERQPRREVLSVKTNLLMDFAYMPSGYNRFCPMPNVAIEYYPLHGHFTVGASFDCPWWQDYDAHKYFQARNYQVEGRYYFRSGDIKKNPPGEGAAFRGWYLQAYGHAALYGIMFTAHRGWMGEGLGGGVGAGYVMPLTKDGHWRLEFGAQLGYFYTRYDPFQYGCPVDSYDSDDQNLYYYKWTLSKDLFKERQHRFSWMGPTRVGITLTYDLLYRKIKKKGVSFNKWEY